MNSLRKHSLVAGLFYLLTFVSIPTLALYRSVRGPNFVAGPGPDTPVILGVLLEMVVALAGIGTAVALYPIVKRQGEARAVGFVASRVLEAATIYVGIVSLMSIVTLRQGRCRSRCAGHRPRPSRPIPLDLLLRTELYSGRKRRVAGLSAVRVAPGAPVATRAGIHRSGAARGYVVRHSVRVLWSCKPRRGGRGAANRRKGVFARRLPDGVGLQTLPDHGRYVTRLRRNVLFMFRSHAGE